MSFHNSPIRAPSLAKDRCRTTLPNTIAVPSAFCWGTARRAPTIACWRVFRDDLHPRAGMPVRPCGERRNAVERGGPNRPALLGRHPAPFPPHFPHAVLDTAVVMPNHVHGVIVITEPGRGEASDSRVCANTPAGLVDASPLRSPMRWPSTGFAPR